MVYFRILPLAGLIFLFVRFVLPAADITDWLLSSLVFVVLSVIVLLNAKRSDAIFVKKSAISMVTRRIRGVKETTYNLPDIDFIDVEVYNEPRTSGAYYRLVLKNKRRVMFLKISGDMPLSDERLQALNQNITDLTGLKIHHDWKGIE